MMPENDVQSLANLLDREYGIKTRSVINPLVEEVDIAVTQILGGEPKRVGSLIMNLSANIIHVCFDPQVSAARGIFLAPNGGSVNFVWSQDFNLVSLPLYGSAAADASDIISVSLLIV